MDVTFLVSAFREDQYPPPDRAEIAFAGRSNVGKSSLINVLVNRKGLARTSSKPGRTQSINFFSVGKTLYMVDLPGYGFAHVPVKVKKSWKHMVETYLRTRSNLKAVVVILDIRREPALGDLELLGWLKYYDTQTILVLTKTDKLSRQKANMRADKIGSKLVDIFPVSPTLFSAKTKEGREAIWAIVKQVTGCDLKV
jgi:GTP-binding protein